MRAHGQPRSRAQTLAAMCLLIPLGIVNSACSSTAGSSASPPPTRAAATEAATVASGAGAVAPALVALGGPVQTGRGTGATGTAVSGGGIASNAAIAYPYPGYIGTSGVAADHTIVVTGVGDAPIKADGSNRASAQRTALAAAIADAKAQADLVAQATGVTIHGVLSVSVASGQTYAYPLAAGVEGSAPRATPGGTTVAPPVAGVVQPVAPQYEVSVTVAYQIG